MSPLEWVMLLLLHLLLRSNTLYRFLSFSRGGVLFVSGKKNNGSQSQDGLTGPKMIHRQNTNNKTHWTIIWAERGDLSAMVPEHGNAMITSWCSIHFPQVFMSIPWWRSHHSTPIKTTRDKKHVFLDWLDLSRKFTKTYEIFLITVHISGQV